MKTTLLLVPVLLCAGCYTDSTGQTHWGRRRGPTQAELREQQTQARLAQLEAKYGALQGDMEGMGTSVTSIAIRSDEISKATDARGADAVALRNDQAALERRLAALEAQMAKVPAAIQSEHKAIVAEVNQAIAASDKRTDAAIKAAVAQARSSGGSSSRSASRPADGGQYYEHKVGAGQTVSEIARAYGVTVADVARANNLKAPAYVIRENQTLWIPAK